MARVVWKEGAVLSIETRKGFYVLAQMSREPYIIFFNVFSDNEKWDSIDLALTPILFCKAVVHQFLKSSNITKLKHIKPREINNLPTKWIHSTSESRKVKVWENTENEKEFFWIGNGGLLVEKDVFANKGGPYKHPSGVYDRVIIESIDPLNTDIIDQHEITSLGIYPLVNERLFMCYKLGRNVDPDKDILFNRDLSVDYLDYVKLIVKGH